MDGFVQWMEKHFMPKASVIAAQRHLVAIRDAFVVTMPLMILGALAVLINNIPIPGYEDFLNKIFPMMYNDAPILEKLWWQHLERYIRNLCRFSSLFSSTQFS